MAPGLVAARMERATGQSFECWLSEAVSTFGTGSMAVFSLTPSQEVSAVPLFSLLFSQAFSDEPLLLLTGSQEISTEPNTLPALIVTRQGVTDPEARFRLREPALLNWTRNLHDLNVVTGMILPGMRELTEPEQRNLRGIYKKLRRKA